MSRGIWNCARSGNASQRCAGGLRPRLNGRSTIPISIRTGAVADRTRAFQATPEIPKVVGLEPEPSGDYPDCYSMFGTRFFLGVSERSVGDLDFRFHPSPTVPVGFCLRSWSARALASSASPISWQTGQSSIAPCSHDVGGSTSCGWIRSFLISRNKLPAHKHKARVSSFRFLRVLGLL